MTECGPNGSFQVNPALTTVRPELQYSSTAIPLALGLAGEVLREAGAEVEEKRQDIEAEPREALATYRTGNREVVMQSGSWTAAASNGTSLA